MTIKRSQLMHVFALPVVTLAIGLGACGGDGVTASPITSAPGGYAGSLGIIPSAAAGTPALGTAGKPALPLGIAGSAPIKPIVSPGAAGTAAPIGAAGTPALPVGGGGGGVGALPTAGAGPGIGAGGAAAPGVDAWTPQTGLGADGILTAPAAADGWQVSTATFDLLPGQEIYKCFHVKVPNAAEFPVGMWEAQMTPGSHHFILYRSAGDALATEEGVMTDNACTQGFGGSTWLFTQGSPRAHLQFPEGVAMKLAAHEIINFDMHYINTGTTTIHARVILNAHKVKAEKFQLADAQISFNYLIAVPAHGTQTVSGDCTPVKDAKYFVMQTHTHKHATLAVVNRKLANGSMGEELVRTLDWENPSAHIWPSEPFLTFQPGEKFHYECTYKNDTSSTVTVGISANDEMCMAEAYFFPTAGTIPMCQ